jgi:hypothetical protein
MNGTHRRRRCRLACLWVCLAAGAGACGNDKPSAPPSGDDGGARQEHPADDGAAPDQSGMDDTGPLSCPLPDGGISGAACNDLIAAGPCVGQIQVDDNAPAPRGGGLAAGTFELTERVLYTNPGGATGPIGEPVVETLVLRGAGTSWTLDQAGFTSTTSSRTSARVTISGVTIRLLPTCPGGDGGPPADAGDDGGPPADPGDAGDDGDDRDDGGLPADAGGGGPAAGPGELVYYTSFDSGASMVLFRLGSAGPVRADTYVRR